MPDLESSFLQTIGSQPHDWLPRLIFADWLEERGDPRGELIRLSHKLTRLECADRQQKEARLQELSAAGVVWPSPSLSNSLDMKFVLIPPGSFQMGSPASEKDHTNDEAQVNVTISKGYWLGPYQVTQAKWEAVMGTTPWNEEDFVKAGDSYPATSVSWEDASEFCAKLTAKGHAEGWLSKDWKLDLPTEAQWEYACRAGTETAYSFGNDETKLSEYAWFDNNTWEIDETYAHQVGLKKANPWGLHDMHGNVWEWCCDRYVKNSREAKIRKSVTGLESECFAEALGAPKAGNAVPPPATSSILRTATSSGASVWPQFKPVERQERSPERWRGASLLVLKNQDDWLRRMSHLRLLRCAPCAARSVNERIRAAHGAQRSKRAIDRRF